MEKTARKIITNKTIVSTNEGVFVIEKQRKFKNFYELIQFYGYRKGTQNNITSYAKQLMIENVISGITIVYDNKTERELFFEFNSKQKKYDIVVCDIDRKRGIKNYVYY